MVSRKVKVSRPAKNDLDEIWLYIAQDNLEAADRFVDSITDRFKNYLILYRSLKGRIEVVRVVQGARDLEALFK